MEGGVKSMEITNIDQLVKFVEAKVPIFIKFYMNQCGHCVTLKPTWDKVIVQAKEKHKGKKIAIVEVEAAVLTQDFLTNLQKHVSNVKKVTGFPTIGTITYANNKAIYKDHDKGREEKALMQTVDELAKQSGDKQSGGKQSGGKQSGAAKRTKRKRQTKRRQTKRKGQTKRKRH
jgi:hypothetical protein